MTKYSDTFWQNLEEFFFHNRHITHLTKTDHRSTANSSQSPHRVTKPTTNPQHRYTLPQHVFPDQSSNCNEGSEHRHTTSCCKRFSTKIHGQRANGTVRQRSRSRTRACSHTRAHARTEPVYGKRPAPSPHPSFWRLLFFRASPIVSQQLINSRAGRIYNTNLNRGPPTPPAPTAFPLTTPRQHNQHPFLLLLHPDQQLILFFNFCVCLDSMMVFQNQYSGRCRNGKRQSSTRRSSGRTRRSKQQR